MEMKERESRRRGGEKTYITLVVLLFCSKNEEGRDWEGWD